MVKLLERAVFSFISFGFDICRKIYGECHAQRAKTAKGLDEKSEKVMPKPPKTPKGHDVNLIHLKSASNPLTFFTFFFPKYAIIPSDKGAWKMYKKELFTLLRARFEKNMHRHEGLSFADFEDIFSPEMIEALIYMEETGGEPDLVVLKDGRKIYVDMSKETPKDRRSFCYDLKARVERKKNAPESSCLEECQKHGVKLVDEEIYRNLQEVEDLDLKTSSWILTPDPVRKLGGAIFGDKRYDRTFVYHNGADSYYSARAFRTYIEI